MQWKSATMIKGSSYKRTVEIEYLFLLHLIILYIEKLHIKRKKVGYSEFENSYMVGSVIECVYYFVFYRIGCDFKCILCIYGIDVFLVPYCIIFLKEFNLVMIVSLIKFLYKELK